MRIGSSSAQPFALPTPAERDPSVQRIPARDRESLGQTDESVEEVRQAEPKRRATQRVDANDRVQRLNLSKVRDLNDLPTNNRNAIATYTATARLSSKNDGVGELVGIDEIV